MECNDLFHRVSGERKSVGIEDCAVITKTVSQQSPPPSADVIYGRALTQPAVSKGRQYTFGNRTGIAAV